MNAGEASGPSPPVLDLEPPRAVILFSHGSLLCGAGVPLDRHAERLRGMPEFNLVEVGYLNYSTPTFEDAVVKVAATGATSIVVVPFFLAPGYFVTTSLPKLLAEIAPRFPKVTITVAGAVGYDDLVAEAVRTSAYGAVPPARWRDGLVEARASCRMQADCPMYGERSCRAGNDSIARFVTHQPSMTYSSQSLEGRRSALLVLAHGSPKAEANEPMLQVIERVRELSREFCTVKVGYLECNQPSIADAIDQCAEAEPSLIVTVPYFLHAGTHVASDLPDALDEGRVRYPHIEFALGEFLGNMPQVTDVLAKRARRPTPLVASPSSMFYDVHG